MNPEITQFDKIIQSQLLYNNYD